MVSLNGFSMALPVPPAAGEVPCVIHLPSKQSVQGRARSVTDRGASLFGFELILDVENLKKWAMFIEIEAQRGGLWRLLNRYATENQEVDSDLGTVRQKTSLVAFLKQMGMARNEEDVPESVMRLHMVGENLVAFELAFQRFGGVVPEKSDMARTVPNFLEVAQSVVNRVLPGDVWLRVAPESQVEPFFVVELKRGGYAYVRVTPEQGAQLVGLTGAELIVLEMDGRQLFPFFSDDELARINRDAFRRDSSPGMIPVVMGQSTLYDEDVSAATPFHHLTAGRSLNLQGLADVVARAERVDTRFYGSKVIKLFPEVYVRIDREGQSHSGFAMQDSTKICVFALSGPAAPRVISIVESDRLEILTERPPEWGPASKD
jgi:hypothetical protein